MKIKGTREGERYGSVPSSLAPSAKDLVVQLQRILVPVDFSATGKVALQVAASLARPDGAALLLVHVISHGKGGAIPAAHDPQEAARRLEAIEPPPPVPPFERLLLRGDPAEELIACAEREAVDLVVLGTHGLTGLSRWLMGSVAEKVVRNANCPVLTVKIPPAEQSDD